MATVVPHPARLRARPTASIRHAPAPRIAIASGKGGVGKTVLASALAHATSRPQARTLLIDGDLGLANVDVQLGLLPERTIADIISQRCSAREAMVDAGGFDVIAGASGNGSLASMPMGEVARLISATQTASTDHGLCLLDLSGGVSGALVRLALSSDLVLVVVTADPTSLTDAYALIKVLHACNAQVRIAVAVNQARDHADGGRTFEAVATVCRSFLAIDPALAGIVRHDLAVQQAIRRQTGLMDASPDTQAARDIAAMARRLPHLLQGPRACSA